MAGKHLKRLAAPRAVQIHRKEFKWTYKVTAGPHPVQRSIPLALVVRDYLKLCDTAREATRILQGKAVFVDGRVVTRPKFAVGLMDVVSIPGVKLHFRVLLDRNGRLALHAIDESAAGWKLCRIEDKSTQKGGRTQLNLHDGRNLLVKEDAYKTGAVLKLKVPEQKVLSKIEMKEGSVVFLTGGSHVGELATFVKLEEKKSPKPNLVHLQAGDAGFATIKPYVFPVGEGKAEISIPEEIIV